MPERMMLYMPASIADRASSLVNPGRQVYGRPRVTKSIAKGYGTGRLRSVNYFSTSCYTEAMTARRIKWKTYWNFMKLTHRLPRKPERKIIKSVANMADDLFEGLLKE